MKDTKKYKESRQLPKGGYLYKDRVEPESSTGAPSISSMSENKENNVNEYNDNGKVFISTLIFIEPPYTERYVRWCERTVGKIITYLLLD